MLITLPVYVMYVRNLHFHFGFFMTINRDYNFLKVAINRWLKFPAMPTLNLSQSCTTYKCYMTHVALVSSASEKLLSALLGASEFRFFVITGARSALMLRARPVVLWLEQRRLDNAVGVLPTTAKGSSRCLAGRHSGTPAVLASVLLLNVDGTWRARVFHCVQFVEDWWFLQFPPDREREKERDRIDEERERERGRERGRDRVKGWWMFI